MLSRLRSTLLLALLAALAPAVGASPDLGRVEAAIVESTNQFRRDEGLRTVDVDRKLARAARAFANYMADTDRYGHEVDGKKPSQRVKIQGYDYCLVSENIAYQYSSRVLSTEELGGRYFEGWKNSPGHRRNMLEPAARDTAVAVAQSATGYYYAVQLFGRPQSAGCPR